MMVLDQKKSPLVESQSFKPPPAHTQNVRYILAKQKIDDLFLKFLSQPSTNEVIANLLRDLKNGGIINDNNMLPPPIFTTHKLNLHNSMTSSTILMQSPIQRSPSKHNPITSPRSPTEKDNGISTNGGTNNRMRNNSGESPQKAKQSIVNPMANSTLLQSIMFNKANYDEIPQFYFGDSLKCIDQTVSDEQNKCIADAFGKQNDLQVNEFKQLTTQLLELPSFFNSIVFNQIDKQRTGKISKAVFMNYWKNDLQLKEPKERCFHILKKSSNEFIERTDFLQMMGVLLETHPGLEFLKATPEFQDRYADTVVIRIFFILNRKDDGRITWKEFNKSNLFRIFQLVDAEEDINKVRDYFSYEHFYVLYCKFWELDQDHDFLITKEEFSKYSGHALSRKTVDIIFNQIPRKFKSQDPNHMGYEDFAWFVLAEEDKTTLTSVEYWFKVIDLDDNGIISGYEMNYFFEEQRQRLEYLNHDNMLFEDFVCQMVDLLKPEDDIKFYLRHFKAKLQQCGIFFNFMTNLNKLVSHETRDPFAVRNEITEHPDFSEWDRFAYNEYLRLAMEEENQDNVNIINLTFVFFCRGEVFNDGIDPWDQETADTSTCV